MAMNELSSNASPEEFITTAFMATESIKAIASQMSPETGQRLIESGITTTPTEAAREFTIPRKERLFPDSIRESISPNEASQEAWHAQNFPHNKQSKNKNCKFPTFYKNFSTGQDVLQHRLPEQPQRDRDTQ